MSNPAKTPQQPKQGAQQQQHLDDDNVSGEYIVTSPIILKRLNKGCSNIMYSCEMGKTVDVEEDLKQAVSIIYSIYKCILPSAAVPCWLPETDRGGFWECVSNSCARNVEE